MRRLGFAIGILVLAGAAVEAQGPKSAHAPIFRYVAINDDTIRLGEPWPHATRYGHSAKDTVIALPAGSFGGTDGIVIYRAVNGLVIRMEFFYRSYRKFATLLGDYRTDLGPALDSSTVQLSGGIRRDAWIWRDPKTEFSLIHFVPARGEVESAAILSNRTQAARYQRSTMSSMDEAPNGATAKNRGLVP